MLKLDRRCSPGAQKEAGSIFLKCRTAKPANGPTAWLMQIHSYLAVGSITPQAIFSPALPEGEVVKSSGEAWIITVLPMISRRVNLLVKNIENALPFAPKSGGKSPE